MSKNFYLETPDGEHITIDAFPFKIGSFNEFCDLTIDRPHIAPIHCMITEDDGNIVIKEMNTKDGINVNGNLLENGAQINLSPNDQISLEDYTLNFGQEVSELLTAEEVEMFNQASDDIQNAQSQEDKEHTARFLIDKLWEKIKNINKSTGNNLPEAINGYLSEVFGDDLTVATATVAEEVVREQTPEASQEDMSMTREQNVEEVKEALRKKSSFEIRRRRRTMDDVPPSNSEQNSSIRSRRVSVDRSKLSSFNPNESSALSNPAPEVTPAPRQPVEHPILSDQPKYIILKETNPPYATIKVEKTPFKIGRSDTMTDYYLDRRGISRVHATIIRDEHKNKFLLKDNNATNGTYLNDFRLFSTESPLNVGDVVRFYEYSFKVTDIQE